MHPAVSLIELYQRFVSPHKGFRCAHAAYHGGCSCSQAVKQIVLADGLRKGLRQIRQRFRDCQAAAANIRVAMNEAENGQHTSPPKKRIRFKGPIEPDDRKKRGSTHPCNFAECGLIPLDCGTIGFEGLGGCEVAGCLSF